MQRVIKRKNFIFALIIALFCFIAGLFFVEKKETTVSASAEVVTETHIDGFEMLNGASLKTDKDVAQLRLTVFVTSEMASNLSKATTQKKNIWGKIVYTPNIYYLRITRKAAGESDYTLNYHIDPTHSDLPSEQLTFNSTKTEAYLVFPFNTNYEKEYTYYCEYGEYGDVPYHTTHGIYYYSGYVSIASASTSVTRSVGYIARMVLQNDGGSLTDSQKEWMNILAGYTTSSNDFQVNLIYKTVHEYGRIETAMKSYWISSLYVGCGDLVIQTVKELFSSKGGTGVDMFDVIYYDMSDTFGRTILKARSCLYSYDAKTETGTITVSYDPFSYQDFAIRIFDNDTSDGVSYKHSIYASYDVSEYVSTSVSNSVDSIGTRILRFNYSAIVTDCKHNFKWLFELEPKHFSVNNYTDGKIKVSLESDCLKIEIPNGCENDLQNLSIYALAEIIEDYECDVELKYSSLTFENNTIVETQETASKKMMYSDYVKFCGFMTFQKSDMYNTVTSALSVEKLNGQAYFTPSGISGKVNNDGSCVLQVEYDYTPLFKITDNQGNVSFVACRNNSLKYCWGDLGLKGGKNLRVSSLTSNAPDIRIEFDEENYQGLEVILQGVSLDEKRIIPLSVTYSDEWNLTIVYMEPYKETPFAERKEFLTEIPISKYDPKKLTLADVKNILGRTDNMGICGLTIPDKTVTAELTSDSTYTVTLTYGDCSLNQISYNGYVQEIIIPLTSFEVWCDQMGVEHTIMFLNNPYATYFTYSNEIEPKDLYGYFSVAVFEEQVSDLNYLFKNLTSDGIIISTQVKEVVGSDVYKFFDRMTDKGLLSKAWGYTGMAFCEIVNDNNKILYSYFFFVDGSNGYISDGGATDRNDNDTAFENFFENVGNEFANGWNEFAKGLNDMRIMFTAIFGVTVLGAVVVGTVWIVNKVRKNKKNLDNENKE